MAYLLVALFVPLFLFAGFKQECRFIRIARNENLSYRQLLAEMASDTPTVVGTLLLIGSFVALAVAFAVGFRVPEDPLPFVGVGVLLLTAGILKSIGFRRLIRR